MCELGRVEVLVGLLAWSFACAVVSAANIGENVLVPDNPRSHYSRYVNFRPADGEAVKLNPPRFSWPYWPDWPNTFADAVHTFTFQIAAEPEFRSPVVNVVTPYNFYNTIPALEGAQRWFWRIGYDIGTKKESWSQVRSFVIAADAVAWDRSKLARPDLSERGHPRIIFNRDNLDDIRRMRETNEASKAAWDSMKRRADETLRRSWWKDFPRTDREKQPKGPFYSIAADLAVVAFVWKISGDDAYAGVKERAVKLASYPIGGRASPEGAGGDSNEDSTQTNEFLALLFDWLYQDLTPQQREIMIRSLEWRTDYWMNRFAWRDNRRGNVIRPGSLSGCVGSHQFEGSMDSAVMGLALYEHSAIGREWFDLMSNYLIGVTNGFGFDEAWNEGPGYGNSKMKWLMNATMYFDTALPYAHLGRNPYYRAIGDFFCRVTPVGLPHSPWGNGSANESYYRRNHVVNFRQLAFLTGEGRFLRNWRESGGKVFGPGRPWSEYALPHYYKEPKEELESELVQLFPVSGWVTATTEPPSSEEGFQKAVGVIFQCRPRGGYSHSFNSDASFQIHAYGQQINHGGGSTSNKDACAYHTMSHTTILVDGLGQAQPDRGQTCPAYGRVVAFDRGENYTYFAGDATCAYPSQPGQYGRWGLPLDGHWARHLGVLKSVYEERALDYLRRFVRHVLFVRGKYFVIFDDLETEPDHPARFTWLYHILPEKPFEFDPKEFAARYAVEDVRVLLAHIANRQDLDLEDRLRLDAMVNPFTGEDYRDLRRKGLEPEHNLWITNRKPASAFHFLTVIYPYRQSDPPPMVARVDDFTVRVESGGQADVIHFGGTPPKDAAFVVDWQAIAKHCGRAR